MARSDYKIKMKELLSPEYYILWNLGFRIADRSIRKKFILAVKEAKQQLRLGH